MNCGHVFVTFVVLLLAPLVSLTRDNVVSSQFSTYDRYKQFKFNTKEVDGKKIAVMSPNSDPERGRRSILVAEGEDSPLQPAAFGRHFHKFISPFDDQIPLNTTILKIDREFELLAEIEDSLKAVKKDLEEEKQLLKSASQTRVKNGSRKSKKEKQKQRRRERIKRERKKRRKQRKKEKALMRLDKKKRNKGLGRKKNPKLTGSDACHYKTLRRCAKKLKLLPRKDVPIMSDFIKCSQRKKFLECVENRMTSHRKSCDAAYETRGNLPGLRVYIKKLFWTVTSCLLNEALKGR